MKFTLLSLITLSLFISSCKKEETKEETPQPQVNLPDSIVVLNTSTLISALNGYSFEAARRSLIISAQIIKMEF